MRDLNWIKLSLVPASLFPGSGWTGWVYRVNRLRAGIFPEFALLLDGKQYGRYKNPPGWLQSGYVHRRSRSQLPAALSKEC